MPSSARQKQKLLYLLKIFTEQTDDNHCLSTAQLITALAAYDIKAERKSIYSDIEALQQYGIDIEGSHTKTFGYYLAQREFELPQLKLLVDAVLSCQFITPKKSQELIKKLTKLTSQPQANQLQRQLFIAERPKAINEEVYYNIDAIQTAITGGRKISFKYFDYDLNKQRIYRKAGESYTLTPLLLCWFEDKYYLICYNAKYDDYNHFRVDRISNVSLTEQAADVLDTERFDVSLHVKQVFGMYGGKKVKAQLSFDNDLLNTVLDRFGTDILIMPQGERFLITVEIVESPVFLGWMAQFGKKAEILAPEGLRDLMKDLLRQLHTLYRD